LTLANRNTTSQEEALKRIASLPPTRRNKVRDIRRQIAAGTYKVGERLDGAMNRVLETLTP
jgi:anti-sigma28 factor (negative regulator of flagellin synthesis)